IKAYLKIKSLSDELYHTNKKFDKALKYAKTYKIELEKKNRAVIKEKEKLENFSKVQKETFNNLISMLASIIESKRQYHRGHSKKVAEISVFIAKELNLQGEQINKIEIAALLHEIGKLVIPDSLETKSQEEFTPPEKDFMITHPIKGASLLEKFSGFEDIAKIIRHTHENVDGTGIPDRLEGEKIPIGSRIIAVANFFDLFVYRKQGGSIEKAFFNLDKHIGVWFDARIVHMLHKYVHTNIKNHAEFVREVKIHELERDMIIDSSIITIDGKKLLPAGTKLTQDIINKIANYNKTEPLEETVFVRTS
ncbi:MAG: HD domain-containing protein, partial [Desulfobacterales bacterium]|nr:HD domain-containing protein [Desulfobacterales bacterium]